MDEVVKKQKPTKSISIKQDRATLTLQVSAKVDAWLKQIEEKLSGSVAVNRSDLVNFFLEKQAEVLSKDQIEKIRETFFDEVRFAQWALTQVKESKKKGESLSLKDVINLSKALDSDAPKKPRKTKGDGLTSAISEKSSNEGVVLISDETIKP